MKRYIVLLIMLVFALGACEATKLQEKEPTKEKICLQWKWEKGKTYKYKMIQEMKQTMSETPQGDMETSTNQVAVYSQKVTEVDDKGVATIEFKYESIKVEMDNPMMGKTTFDSTNEEDMKKAEEDPQLAAFAAMVRKPFIVKMGKDGKVVEVKGFSKLVEELLENLNLKDDPMVDQLKDVFSDESMKKMLQQSYAQLPKEEVAIGDSWETSLETPFPPLMTIKTKGKNTYKGNETVGGRKCARIDTQMDMTISMDPNSPLSQMFDIEWEPVPSTTTLYFDLEEGTMVKQEVKMNMKATLTSKMGGEKMKMEQEMTMKMELVE